MSSWTDDKKVACCTEACTYEVRGLSIMMSPTTIVQDKLVLCRICDETVWMSFLEKHSRFCCVTQFYEQSIIMVDADLDMWSKQVRQDIKQHKSALCDSALPLQIKFGWWENQLIKGPHQCVTLRVLHALKELLASAVDCDVYSVLTLAKLSRVQHKLAQMYSVILPKDWGSDGYTGGSARALSRNPVSSRIRNWCFALQRTLPIKMRVVRGLHKCSFKLASMRIEAVSSYLPRTDWSVDLVSVPGADADMRYALIFHTHA